MNCMDSFYIHIYNVRESGPIQTIMHFSDSNKRKVFHSKHNAVAVNVMKDR